MPEPVRTPADLRPWTPATRPVGRCRHCGQPACTVDETGSVCHPGCGVPAAAVETHHQEELELALRFVS